MKKGSTAQEECSNCAASVGADGSALKKCSKCKLVSYCSQACQLQHWRDGGHKRFCLTPEERAKPSPAALAEDPAPKKSTRTCAICSDELISASAITLPCGHSFHKQCLTSLRDFGVSQACPLCRAPLPPRETPKTQGPRVFTCSGVSALDSIALMVMCHAHSLHIARWCR